MTSEERFYEEQPLDKELDPGGEKKLPEFSYDEDAANLVTEFLDHKDGMEALRELSKRMVADFNEAWDDTEDYRAMRAAAWKLFACDLPPKDFPFEDSANVNVPQMFEAITRLVARYKGEIFGDRTSVFNVVPMGADDKKRAEVLSKHGNWQLRQDIPDFFSQMSKAILEWFISGDVTIHSHFDAYRRQNRHECLSCDEFVTPYSYKGTMPDYSDAPYYVRIHHMSVHDLEAMKGKWEGVEAVLKRYRPAWDDEPEKPMAESIAEVEGQEIESGPVYKVLQYEGWGMLPGQKQTRWLQAFIHHATGNIMQLSIHEEPDWKERARYEAQLEERQRYIEDRQLYRDQEQQRQQAEAMAAAPDPQQAQQAMQVLQQEPLPPPMMPSWLNEEEDGSLPMPPEMEMRPIHMFSHGQFIVPLAGNLGLGPGRAQADFNRMSNTAASQFADSATLANCSTLVTSGLVEFSRPFEWAPGKVNKVEGLTGGELRNHIMPLDAKPANPQLMELVKFSMDNAQSSMQSPDVLSGAPGKSGETFRGIQTRVQQASETLSVSAKDFMDGPLRQVLVNNGRLNAIHLPDDEIRYLCDPKTGEAEEIRYGKGLYQRGYDVTITADAKFAPQAQKVADAQELVQMGQADDLLKQNVRFRLEAWKRYLEARDLHDMVPLLQPPPQPPMQPPEPMTGGAASQPKGPNGPAGPAPQGPPM